ncbi:MAG: GntR family transcriptional regulator [Rubrivivax sp.]|nr:GntR family transcriptional regulator [Rubrivivax sp.]
MTVTAEVPASLLATLRQRIIGGHYAAGTRLAEIPVAQALGVSRTPVRLAFRTLAQEGLLEPAGARGFVVRAFSRADVLCAVEVRGVLEGLAARRLAEQGLAPSLRAMLQACIDEGEQVLARGTLDEEAITAWSRVNERFHRAIVEGGDSRVIAETIARNNHLPFASADAIVIERSQPQREFRKLHLAQMQHVLVFDALTAREGARVEMLMREHAWIGFRYGRLFGWEQEAGADGQPGES